MRNKNLLLQCLTSLVLTMLVLTGCVGQVGPGGAASPAGETAPEAGEAPEVIELTYWHTNPGPAGEAQDELVEMFNESQDSIHVTSEFQGGYSDLATNLLTAFAAGGGPEVTQLGTFEIREFYKSGVIIDVKPFIDGATGFVITFVVVL